MLTALLIFFPFVAGLLVLLMLRGEQARKVTLLAAIAEFIIALFVTTKFVRNADVQFVMNQSWINSMGIHFHVGLDGISLLMVLLTTFLVPVIVLSSFNREYKNPHIFYALILFMQMALVGVFTSLDGFLFYIFWELALIPIWFICLVWGGEGREKITFKFFVYTLLGSLFMLAALIYVYLQTGVVNNGSYSFDINALYQAASSLPAAQQSLVFWGMFLAFAIKMPVFPFHTWQPDTYVSAPTPGTMLLSGIMLKMGTYGLIRWLIPMVPQGTSEWGGVAIGLSVIGIVYASCIAIAQKDYKRLIAYSSIAHIGLIAAGILAFNVQGITGGVMQMLSHGINVVGLFLIADILLLRTGTRNITELGGIRNVNTTFTTLFMIIMLGSVALPLTNGFVGEFLLINGVYQFGATAATFAGLSVILGAVYMLRSFQSVMLGETNKLTEKFGELSANEKTVLLIICVMVIVMGVYPKPLLDIAAPAIEKLAGAVTLIK